jgi:probable blue pigment (indigoidine) exporter
MRLFPSLETRMQSTRNALLFVLLSVVWGSGFVVVKLGQRFFPSVFYAALCFDVTALVLFAYVLTSRGQWRPTTRGGWLAVGAISLFTVTVYNALFFVGQRGAPSAVGAIILSFIPLITALLARVLVPGRRFAPAEVVGVLVGLAGVALIVRPTPAAVATGDVSRLLILIAAASNALGGVLVQRFEPATGTPVLLAWAMPPGAVALHLVSRFVVRESYADLSVTLPSVLAVAYFALVVTVLGYLIFFSLLRRVGAFEVSLVNYLQPMVAAVVGWLVLREELDPVTVVGFVVIVVGFALVKRDQVRERLQ